MIPKELKGDVQKFEDVCGYYFTLFDYVHWRKCLAPILDFYTQPFKPEMIEEYFEGWKKEKIFGISYESGKDFVITAENLAFAVNRKMSDIKPKTLSDFVDVCLNSDIKLKWR